MTLHAKTATTLIWGAALACGLRYSWSFAATPGRSSAVSRWPTESSLRLDSRLPTVLVFAHPECPCTLATLDGVSMLDRLGTPAARVEIVFVQFSGLQDVQKTKAFQRARRIPGARLIVDRNGVEAKRFGAATSGQALLFDPEGRRLFRGGLTAFRGEVGPSAGLDAVEAILQGLPPRIRSTPVLGCAFADLRKGASL